MNNKEIIKKVSGEDGWCAFCKIGLETGENYCEECRERLEKALAEKDKIERNYKTNYWELYYPDGTSSMMTYDPIEFEKEKVKKFLDKEKKIMEWHNLVVKGLVNGLTHTYQDERLNDINFWRKRCDLFNEFSKCVLDISTNQNYEYAEKNLKEIAEEGYKAKEQESEVGE